MKWLQEIYDILITKNIDISEKCAFVHRTHSERTRCLCALI